MTNTTHQFSENDPATIEGLDHVFNPIQEVIQDSSLEVQDQVQEVVQDTEVDQSRSTPRMISLREAAEVSGKARRYLLSLIHKEKIDGQKDESGAWMVPMDQIQDRFGSNLEQVQDVIQEQGVEVQEVVQDQVQEVIQEVVQEQIQGTGLNIQSLFRELQAATYRNGYLESQLAQKDEQLKLLPDFEAKAKRVETMTSKVSSLESLVDSKDSEIETLRSELSSLKESGWRKFMKWFLGG